VWWHLATGRYIVQRYTLPSLDPFSFTMAGKPWIGIDWLAEVLMYGAHYLAGDAGPTLLSVLAVFAALVCLGLALRELGVSRGPALATLAAVALLAQWRWSLARPLTLGAACAAFGLYLVARTWAHEGKSPWQMAFPLLVLLWSAIHPTVVLGAVEAAVLCIALLMARRPERWTATVAALMSVGALLIGPGRIWLLHSASIEDAKLATELTIEWRRASITDVRTVAAVLWIAIGLVGALGRVRKHLPFVLLSLCAGALALRWTRNAAEAVLLAAPLSALAFERVAEICTQRGLALFQVALPALLALSLPIVQIAFGGPRAFSTRFGLGPDVHYRPVQTLDALRALPLGRVMNDCTFGGWLIWNRVPVYCDGRTVTLYRESDVRELWLPLFDGEAAIDQVAKRFEMVYFLARAASPFEAALTRSQAFVPIAYDRESALFARRAHAPDPLLDDLRWVDDQAWMDQHYRAVIADARRRDRLRQAIARTWKSAPDALALIGVIEHMRRAHPDEAQAIRALLEK
jgi:hypothetical protein